MSNSDIFDLVYKFNAEVVGIGERKLNYLGRHETSWLRSALVEEAMELEDALAKGVEDRIVSQVDACADSIIFAIGGLARLGVTKEQARQILTEVMVSNFQKRSGVKEGRTGAADAIKPEGWIGPENRIKRILSSD